MDVLSIRDLRISCIVGVYPHERKHEQDLFVDVDMWQDFSGAARSDRLTDTVDYTRVTEELTAFVCAERFQLIEALAHRACDLLLASQPSIRRCRISIRKPSALVTGSARRLGREIALRLAQEGYFTFVH